MVKLQLLYCEAGPRKCLRVRTGHLFQAGDAGNQPRHAHPEVPQVFQLIPCHLQEPLTASIRLKHGQALRQVHDSIMCVLGDLWHPLDNAVEHWQSLSLERRHFVAEAAASKVKRRFQHAQLEREVCVDQVTAQSAHAAPGTSRSPQLAMRCRQ